MKTVWLALSYSVPITPSKARVYVWRKLRECGAEYLRQGIAVLPNSALNLQEFSVLAQKIRQMGGEAMLLDMRFLETPDEQSLRMKFRKQSQQEYQALLLDCANILHCLRPQPTALSRQESEAIRKLVKRYCKIRSRDYFKVAKDSLEIEQGLSELLESVRGAAGEFSRQMHTLLDG